MLGHGDRLAGMLGRVTSLAGMLNHGLFAYIYCHIALLSTILKIMGTAFGLESNLRGLEVSRVDFSCEALLVYLFGSYFLYIASCVMIDHYVAFSSFCRCRGVKDCAGRPVAESRGGGTRERVGRGGRGKGPRRGNDERIDELNGQGNNQGVGANGGIEGVNGNVKGLNGGCSYKEFLACNLKEYDGKGGGNGYSEKGKNQAKMDKTEHGMEKRQKVKANQKSQQVKADDETEEILSGQPIRTLNQEVAVCMSWNDFKFMMIEEFCLSHEMQKLEIELWNHTMVGASHTAYTDRFHELARTVEAMEPKTMQKAVQISGALNDEAVRNGSIKKVEKRGNVGEPSKDKNGRYESQTE
ncbi:hypothetical protein Tco_0454486 [Tanacetum coccineum]